MGDLVRVIDSEARTTSLMVAEAFGKQHFNLLRAIDNLIDQDPSLASNFGCKHGEVAISNGGKRQSRYYAMDQEGFMLLVMGFTGALALKVKRAFIGEFKRMEAVLASTTLPSVAIARSKVLDNPMYATPEARDSTQLMLNTARRIERSKGPMASYAYMRENGLEDVDALMVKWGVAPAPAPAIEEKRMATLPVWVEDAGVERSGSVTTNKFELWADYQAWASQREMRFMEPTPFYKLLREHFAVEERGSMLPIRVTRVSIYG